MKRHEAADLVAHAKTLWGTAMKITAQTADEWAQHAGDLHPTLIRQALDAYAAEGREFPPPLGTLMARARGLRPKRSWDNDSNEMQCYECSGPTLVDREGNRQAHFAFCPTYGTGPLKLTKPAADPEWYVV